MGVNYVEKNIDNLRWYLTKTINSKQQKFLNSLLNYNTQTTASADTKSETNTNASNSANSSNSNSY